MRSSGKNCGFSMLEILTAVAIVSILAMILLGVGKRLKTQADERLAKSTIEILVTAISSFMIRRIRKDFASRYRPRRLVIPTETIILNFLTRGVGRWITATVMGTVSQWLNRAGQTLVPQRTISAADDLTV